MSQDIEPIDCCPVCERALPYYPNAPEHGRRIIATVEALHGLNPAAYREVLEALKACLTRLAELYDTGSTYYLNGVKALTAAQGTG